MSDPDPSHSHLISLLRSKTSLLQAHNQEWTPTSPSNRALLAAAKDLVAALEPPDNAVWRVAFAEEAHAAFRAAIQMRLFSTEECKSKHDTGIIDVVKLSSELAAGEHIVRRIMRALAAVDILSPAPISDSEVEREGYKHTALSIKLADPVYAGFVVGLDDALPRCMAQLPAYLESIGYQDVKVNEKGHTLFNFVFKTEKTMFEWMQGRPDELGLFKKSMRNVNFLSGERVINSLLKLFPEHEDQKPGEEDVLMVDVGGGSGDVMRKFREKRPGLKGKIVVQDLPAVIKGLEDSEEINYMAHSFFDSQPVKGAHTYHLRHILHNHPDEACLQILRHITDAMSSSSRIVLLETVLPASGESTMYSLMDLKMMMMGGMERTEAHWKSLLGQVGLKVTKMVIGSRNGNDAIGVIEAKLV